MAEMASAQLMEEELQHSVMVSEEDGDFEVDGAAGSTATDKADTVASSTEINVRGDDDGPEDQDMDGEGASEDLEEEGSGANLQESSQNGSAQESQDMEIEDGAEDEDAEGEDDDGAYEQDAEGEEDEEDMTVQPAISHGNALETPDDADQDAEGDEDDEGVGAVKIRPGEDDEEEEEEDEDEGSEASAGSEADAQSASDEESEGEEAWEDNAENEEDDEEEENVNSNVCMFCKQDEENDPSEEFETFLACKGCGENAHQQCARENDAIDQRNGPEKWKCPECYDAEREDALLEEGEGEDAEGEEQEGEGDENTSPSSRISNGRLGRELLPAPKPKPDSHSVFNQLVLDEDPMDGSRVLRKRKTSSAEVDEEVMSLRKRRKDTGDEMSVDGETDGEETPRPRSSRSLRQKATNTPSSASITKKTRNSLVVKATLNAAELKKITSQKPKGALKPANKASTSRSSRPGTSRSSVHVGVPLTAPFVSTNFTQPFYSFFDKDTDELKGKPYGGILTEAEADTSKTLPTSEDRRRFDEAKQKAEEEWRERLLRMQEENELPVKKAKKASGPASQIECIEFGGWEIDTWYAAPYPEEYSRNRVLYICEFCLKYMNSDYVAWRHKLKCPAKHPPGDEIYRHGSVSVFEVDGRKNPVYCQNLCLLAKLFLGSKTLYYDVEPFLFYVLCEFDDLGYHFVGYFSKEKRASSQNNVSCILTLPIHQRKGYGNLLIDFSYLLTRVEQKTGSPEKPLSDMGLVSYRNYWRLVLSRYLLKHVPEDRFEPKGLSIKQISDDTGLTPDDVISALEGLRCLVRDPPTGVYAFRVDLAYCQEYVAKWEAKKYVTLNPAALTWTPYVMGRNNVANFELGPALTAMASAGDEEEPKPTNGETSAAHKAVNGDGPAPGEVVKAEVDVDANVMESTEPNETSADTNGLVNGEGQAKPDGEQEQNHNAAGAGSVERSHSSAISKKAEDEDWTSAYKAIPPTRFVVYPPLNARRVDRPRPTLGSVATPVVRTMSASRPRPRRSIGGGSARRASASKPKSSSKRKTGGTGRGPGRWPKGTKKSDYGGADSGPGMPPGWLESRKQAQAQAQLKRDEKKAEREDQAEDTVQVQTITTANAVNGSLHSAEGGGDVVMADGDGDDE